MKLLRQELARSAVGAMSQPKSFIDGEPKLCITLGDGTILFCAPPSEEFPRKIAGLSLLQAMPRSQAPVYLGMSLGAGQAMASSETLSGVIPNGGIPRLILKGKRYLEFRLKGQPPGQDQSISSIGGFQLYGGDAASIERPPKSAMLYSLQPDWVNGLLSFWADPLYKNGWDFVMLIPEDVFPGVPRFVFYNIEIHQVRRDLQIALIAQSQRESFQQTRVQLLSNEKSISLATTEQRSEGRTFQHQQEQVMSKFLATTKSFLTDDRGVTSIEYGLIASLLGVALVTVLGLLSTDLIAVFESIRAAI
jgi:pilus assembly protein Flp/PilA